MHIFTYLASRKFIGDQLFSDFSDDFDHSSFVAHAVALSAELLVPSLCTFLLNGFVSRKFFFLNQAYIGYFLFHFSLPINPF